MTESMEELLAARKAEIAAAEALRAKRRSDLRKFLSGMLAGDAMGLLLSAYMGKQAYFEMWVEPIIAFPCAIVTLGIAIWLYVKK